MLATAVHFGKVSVMEDVMEGNMANGSLFRISYCTVESRLTMDDFDIGIWRFSERLGELDRKS